jgi:membrane protease YdiL (CAAX protease family)
MADNCKKPTTTFDQIVQLKQKHNSSMNSRDLIENTEWRIFDAAIVYVLIFCFLFIFAAIFLHPMIQDFLRLPISLFERNYNDLFAEHWLRYGVFGIVEQLIFIIVPVLWVRIRNYNRLRATWFASNKLSQDFLIGFLLGLTVRLFVSLPSLLYDGTSLYGQFLISMLKLIGGKFVWLEFLRTVIMGPIGESILFVGFTFPVLAKKLGVRLGACATAVVFSILHLTTFLGANLAGILWSFLIGIIAITLYWKRRSIIAPLGFHLAHNLMLMVFILIGIGRIPRESPTAAAELLFQRVRQDNWSAVEDLISSNSIDATDTSTLRKLSAPNRINAIEINIIEESQLNARVLITLKTSADIRFLMPFLCQKLTKMAAYR